MGVEFGLFTNEQMQNKMAPIDGEVASLYHRSQEQILLGERCARDGDEVAAREHWRQAAILQRDFVKKLPPEKPITRVVFAESAAVLFDRAGDHDEAAATRRIKTTP